MNGVPQRPQEVLHAHEQCHHGETGGMQGRDVDLKQQCAKKVKRKWPVMTTELESQGCMLRLQRSDH